MTTATKTRWIDSVARSYEDGGLSPLNLANLYGELATADELAADLAELECTGDCGRSGYGNDPNRTECACTLGDYRIFREVTPAADGIASWIRRINPLDLRNGMDVHLYTRALRVWNLLENMRADDRVEDIRDRGEEIRAELA